MKEPSLYSLTPKTLDAVVSYLGARPWQEVAPLMAAITAETAPQVAAANAPPPPQPAADPNAAGNENELQEALARAQHEGDSALKS